MNIEILLNWGTETLQILDTGSINEAEKQQMPKLEWLKAYRDKLRGWDELLQVATLAEQYVRQEGVTRGGYQALSGQFHEKLPRLEYAPAIKLKTDLIDFVRAQGHACKGNERLLGSSEVIESVFGKQKYLERDYAKEGFTSLVLGIGAFVGTLTVDSVREALVSTPVKMVVDWCKDVLGETLQSKKKMAYSDARNGTKTALTFVCEN